MTAADILVRASLWLALLLFPAVALGAWLLGGRPAARFRWLLATLLLSAPAPLYLSLAAPATGWSLPGLRQPRGLVHELMEAPDIGRAERAAIPATAGARAAPEPTRRLAGAVALVWLGGLAVSLVRLAHGLFRVRGLRRRARPWAERPAAGGVPLRMSDEISGAAVVGLWSPVILIGQTLAAGPAPALDQVLIHEAAHVRRRDPLWGLCERLVQALYWFHPAVALCRRALARAREEACDEPVLARFAPAEYARTLLALAAGPDTRLPVVGAASAGTGLSRRIRRLLEQRRTEASPGRGRTLAAAGVLALAGVWAVAVLAPASAAENRAPTGVVGPVANLAPEFAPAGPDVDGAFVLTELGGPTVVVNAPLARQRLTPASTFKTLIALAGLESGAIPDAHTRLGLGNRPQEIAAWNRDHDLTSAMRTSATWYFEDVLDRLDRSVMVRLLDRLQYGNRDTSGSWRRFWIDGGLRISALEQVDVQLRLRAGASGAGPRSLALLDQVTELGRRGDAVLYGKTGTALGDGETIAWLVGHVHHLGSDRRFGYATLMRAPESASRRLQQARRPITEALLVRHGAWPTAEVSP